MKDKNNFIFYGITVLLLLWIGAESAFLLVYRETWFDELVYLFKGYGVVSGAFAPFRDIILEYPPFAFFAHGAVQAVFGPSIMAGRLTSLIFFWLLLLLVFIIGRRMGGRWAGIGAVALVMSHALLVANYISAVPYALTMLFLLGALAVEFSSATRGAKVFCAALLLAGMMLTRVNMLAAVLIYGLHLFWIRVSPRQHITFWSVLILTICIGYLPIVLPDPALAASSILHPFVRVGLMTLLPASVKVGSVGGEKFLEILAAFFREYAATLAFFSAIALAIVVGRRGAVRDFFNREREFALLAAMAGGLLAAHYFYWRITGSIQYANFFMPLVALAAVVGAVRYFKGERVAAVLVVAVIGINLFANAFPSGIISRTGEETDLERVRRGAEFVAAHTDVHDRIIAFDNSIFHVFAAGRFTEPALINRNFLYIGGIDADTARRLRMYNPEVLMTWLGQADAVVLHEERWRQTFRRPFWRVEGYDGEKIIADVAAYIGAHYEFAGKAFNVYPRKYTEGNDGGTLTIYRRKK